MKVTRASILSKLPPYQDKWVTVTSTQDVGDIIADIVKSHYLFAPYYDRFAYSFSAPTIEEICDNLVNFCKQNIEYREENEDIQSTALPTGIIERGHGDCKHYASFIGGCLSAISRETGVPIHWKYCFASYKLDQKTPYHVFVTVDTPSGTVWCDPTPGADGKQPVWVVYKKINESRIAAPAKTSAVRAVGKLSLVGATEAAPPAAGLTAAQTAYNNNLIQTYINGSQATWGGLDLSKKVTILFSGETISAPLPTVYNSLMYANALYAATLSQLGFSLNPADGFNGIAASQWMQANEPGVYAQLNAELTENANNEVAQANAISAASLHALIGAATAIIGLGLASSIKKTSGASAATTASKLLQTPARVTQVTTSPVLPSGSTLQPSGGITSLLPWLIIGGIAFILITDN